MTRPNPTVRRRRLAAELRRLRKAVGLSLEDAAQHLDLAHSTLSRVETGHTGIRPPDVDALARLYGVTDAERDALVQLARDARRRGWWEIYSDVLTNEYSSYIGFESEASNIRTYEPQTVPGLFQTEDYARALTTAQLPEASDDEVERRVKVRMARQERLTAGDAPRLWAILGEPALRYLVGGEQVMREQLDRLGELSELPHITIQALPYSAGAHPGMGGPFVILSFPIDPDMVYLENLTSGLYLEGQAEVGRYTLIYEHLRAAACRPDESRSMIRRAAAGS